jgi:transcriptional antiterminator RfaH
MPNFNAGWYIAYTAPRKEKKLSEELLSRNMKHFLPLVKSVKKWHDRKKTIYSPAFPSYVFVYLTSLEMYFNVLDIEGFFYFVKFGKVPAIVKQELIDQIALALSGSNVSVSADYFEPGERLIVENGALTGLQCEMIKNKGKNKILVRINLLNRNILADIPAGHLSRLVG